MADDLAPTTEEIAAAEKPFFGGTKLGRHNPPEIPHLTGDEDTEYQKLAPGKSFIDPEGNKRIKPWEVREDADFANVPEGALFTDPEGNTRRKPKYEPLSFTAQMLFDMAQTPEAKKQALQTIYGDKVVEDASGLYINDDGKWRAPGTRDLMSGLGTSAAETAPALGMVGGAVGGSLLGTAVEPGGGTAAGGYLGMVGGAMLGHQFNNVMLSLAGIHQGVGEQIKSMGWEGAAAAGGEVIGKTVAAVPGAVRAARSSINKANNKISGLTGKLPDVLESLGISPEKARSFLGTTPATAEQAASISERGGKVPPSVLAPEAPFLKKIEEFDAVFRSQNVFGEAARDFYEQEAARILENEAIGLTVDAPLTAAEKKVSSRQAGQLAINAARTDMAQSDTALENATRALKQEAQRPIEELGGAEVVKATQEGAIERLNIAHRSVARNAENLLRRSVADLDRDVSDALLVRKSGEDPSALNRAVDAQFEGYNRTTRLRARQMYDAGDAAANLGPKPNTKPLASHAEAFFKSLPEALRDKYPSEIADLARLAADDAEPLSWGQLHHLRSWFRHGIDYQDLTPDMREGALKHFEKLINGVLHDPNAPATLKNAAVLLDQADAFYKSTIPFLKDQIVTTLMKALESGAGVDAKVVASVLFDPGRTAALRRARSIVGENVWRGVEAAHVQNLISQSQTATPGTIDFARFAAQVTEQVRNGLIDTAYTPQMAARLRSITTAMGVVEGSIPIPVEATDTLSTIMRRGAAYKAAATKVAEEDPLKALAQEMSRLDKEHNIAQQKLRAERRQEPLNFLYENSMSEMAVRAADKILGSPDLILAAAQKFGRDSNEFKALQKVFVQRWFQRPIGTLGGMRAELADPKKGITEEVQALMLPGVTKDAMVQLTKDMEFLFSNSGSDMGGSLAAASRVLNPTQHIPIPTPRGVLGYLVKLPGINFASRIALQKVFATTMDAVSHPEFIMWLAGRLKGSPEEREIARTVLQNRLKLGGLIGAATGQVEQSGAGQPVIPMKSFAEGGEPPVGEPVLVGEHGPEVVVLNQPGTVIPNQQLPTGTDLTAHMLDFNRQKQGQAAQKTAQRAAAFPGNLASGLLSIPQHAFEESERLRTTGEFDAGPVLDAALLGTGFGKVPTVSRGVAGPVGRSTSVPGAALDFTALSQITGSGAAQAEPASHENVPVGERPSTGEWWRTKRAPPPQLPPFVPPTMGPDELKPYEDPAWTPPKGWQGDRELRQPTEGPIAHARRVADIREQRSMREAKRVAAGERKILEAQGERTKEQERLNEEYAKEQERLDKLDAEYKEANENFRRRHPVLAQALPIIGAGIGGMLPYAARTRLQGVNNKLVDDVAAAIERAETAAAKTMKNANVTAEKAGARADLSARLDPNTDLGLTRSKLVDPGVMGLGASAGFGAAGSIEGALFPYEMDLALPLDSPDRREAADPNKWVERAEQQILPGALAGSVGGKLPVMTRPKTPDIERAQGLIQRLTPPPPRVAPKKKPAAVQALQDLPEEQLQRIQRALQP